MAWTDGRMDDLANRMDAGFERVDARFERVEGAIQALRTLMTVSASRCSSGCSA